MKRFLSYTLTIYTVSLYLLGSLFLSLALLLPETNLIKSISEIIKILGAGILITTLVSSILNYYFQTNINRYFSIISGADKSGIRKIYVTRKEVMIEINSEFEKARGKIQLLSIAGTTFFHGDEETHNILHELGNLCKNDSNQSVKILLLHPLSKHACDRAIIEEGFNISNKDISDFKYYDTTLWKNITHSLDQLERILVFKKENKKENFDLDIRLYDTAPILLLVQVNSRIFIEQYHYGITEEEMMQINLIKCIGKKVPVIEFYSNSPPGILWESHFDYLWQTSSQYSVYPGFTQHLKDVDKNAWLEIYKGTKNISDIDL